MNSAIERLKIQSMPGKALFAALVFFQFLSLTLLFIWLMLLPSMNRHNLLALFNRHADTAVSEVTAIAYPALADAVSGFLSGGRPTAQTEVESNDGLRTAFLEHEIVHLHDVKALVDLARNFLYICLTLLLLATMLLLRGLLMSSRPIASVLVKGLLYSGGAFVLLVLAAALWGILDFDGAFTVLHRLAFRNELWLLNPQQDLLIQLMPQPFFEEYALWGLKNIGWALGVLVLLISIGYMADRRRKR